MVDRDKRLNVLLSDDERRMLSELAEALGLDVSSYLRQFIRREHARVFAADRPAQGGKPQR